MRRILGISAFYHDSAAALLVDGSIVAAAQEERFTRRKNDERFPISAIEFCLRRAGIALNELDAVVFYDKPIVKFARTLETFLSIAPSGLKTFLDVIPNWLGERLNLPRTIREELEGLAKDCPIYFSQHHQAHAASAFFPSPFERAAILTVDGVGEYATTTLGRGEGKDLQILKEIRFPHSLGLLYSSFTAYCGFRVNSGEYKLMGLAPYGKPRFVDAIYERLIEAKEDGSFRLNLDYFNFLKGQTMTHEPFHQLFEGPPRLAETEITQRHMDVAASIQRVTEEIMLRLSRHARELTGLPRLCLAGGVALNCVANGRILKEGIFDRLWIQPAAGDAGGALGAALALHYAQDDSARVVRKSTGKGGAIAGKEGDAMKGSLLGPEFDEAEIEDVLKSFHAVYERLDEPALLDRTVRLLMEEKAVGWFQGRMEFGPRALGNRSILGDPRSTKIQSTLNLKVKFRESFRPFAPAVVRERAADYFDLKEESPYMLIVVEVRDSIRKPADDSLAGLDRLKQVRSELPAITHVDYTARVQTVDAESNPLFYRLLKSFEAASGCPVLVNTSFNVRGEPVVCSPDDAYRCFVNTNMDFLVLGSFLLDRKRQPAKEVPQTFHPVPD